MLLATRTGWKRNTSPHKKKGVFVFFLNFGNFWRVGRGWSHLFGIRRVSLQLKRTPTDAAGMEMWQSKPGQKRTIDSHQSELTPTLQSSFVQTSSINMMLKEALQSQPVFLPNGS